METNNNALLKVSVLKTKIALQVIIPLLLAFITFFFSLKYISTPDTNLSYLLSILFKPIESAAISISINYYQTIFIFFLFLLVYLFWFAVVWCIHHRLFIALISLLIFPFASYHIVKAIESYKCKPQLSSVVLNYERENFAPSVVILKGTFSATTRDFNTRQIKSTSGYFEIIMRGANYYFAKRWRSVPGGIGNFENIRLIMPGFSGFLTKYRNITGHHSRGTSQDSSKGVYEVAQRLWKDSEFVGATSEDTYESGYVKERFMKLSSFGGFKIPMEIEFASDGTHEFFHVQSVEFQTKPDTNFFHEIKELYFKL